MKRKLFAGLLCCLLLLPFIGTAYAESNINTVDRAQDLVDGIVALQLQKDSADSVQAWIDNGLTQNAGLTSEWYAFALSQSGDYDFSAYERALLSYLDTHTVASASSRLKYALVLSSIGSTDSYISVCLNGAIGKQGVVSWIYGLHFLNNGYESAAYTRTEVLETLLSLQHEDGGWSITGNSGDVDVTAMAVQALSVAYGADADVTESVDAALAFLSAKQKASGGFSSYGVENPESAAQVIVALSSLHIDFQTDTRFIKNGNTMLDAILDFRLEDGSFSHTSGGVSNENATVQVYYAMVAYFRLMNGEGALYLLDRCDPDRVEPEPILPDTESETEEQSQPAESDRADRDQQSRPLGYKVWACLAIVCVGMVAVLILFCLGKRHYKNVVAIAVAAGLLICFVCFTDLQSADDYYGDPQSSKENAIGSVTLTIRCDTVVGKSDASHIPDDGVILDVTELEISQGETVYDILIQAAKANRIQVENNGTEDMAYIVGIGYLYEFDFGDLSGWVYRVNGERPSASCGEYELRDGDVIEWLYSCELGNDLK